MASTNLSNLPNLSYMTILSLTKELAKEKPDKKVSLSKYIATNKLVWTDISSKHYWESHSDKEFEILCFSRGTSLISEILDILEPLVKDHGEAVVEIYGIGIIEKCKTVDSETIDFDFLPSNDETWSKTPFAAKAKKRYQQNELSSNVLKFNTVTGNDEELLIGYLTKMLNSQFNLTVYLIGITIYFGFKQIKCLFPYIPKEELGSFFILNRNSLFVSNKTFQELEDMNKIVKMYCVENVNYTFIELLEKFKIPEIYMVKFFEKSKENPAIFLCKNEKVFLEISELY